MAKFPSKKAVVVGMGYVGIPLACLLAESGRRVVGIDKIPERVKLLNRGEYPMKGREPDLPELLKLQVATKRLSATTKYSECRDADAVFVCIDTPIDGNHLPRYDHILQAIGKIGENIRAGTLVVVESTIAPGTMREKVLPTLEKKSGLRAGKNLYLAHCPERVMSGRLLRNLTTLDRVLGGLDARSSEIAAEWYSPIMQGKIHITDMTSAEVVKTAENAYRDTEIAFANEVGLICESLGLDAYEVRKLVNTCPGRDMLMPGAGVGGHCLPKDPWLLVYGGRKAKPKLIPMARQVNDSMPLHVAGMVDRAIERTKLERSRKTTIVIFGLSFLEDTDDARNSPSKALLEELRKKYTVLGHDPYVREFEGVRILGNVDSALRSADCAVFMTRHREYLDLTIKDIARKMRHSVVIDGRNIFDQRKARSAFLFYAGVGKG
ncbi:MAG: nucleotide sugar dehydrogenase [Methanomassiliicoccales archaeon]|nr:nucleotide sugar dehydrogenase [Methanomassiliicoccales archaeon]